jgi:hypothetical protein
VPKDPIDIQMTQLIFGYSVGKTRPFIGKNILYDLSIGAFGKIRIDHKDDLLEKGMAKRGAELNTVNEWFRIRFAIKYAF